MYNDLVVMDNVVVNSAYSLSLNEQRLVLAAISKIAKGVPVNPDTAYCVGREDFIKLGVDPNTVAREIRTATKDLMKKTITIRTELGEYEHQWLQSVFRFDREAEEKLREKCPKPEDLEKYLQGARKLNFLEAFKRKLDDDDIVACVVFSREVSVYLTDLKENFTQFELKDLTSFHSSYSIRIYQLIMQFKSTGYRKISLNDLRYTLALGNKYESTKDLRKWVIDTAVDEINAKSPYNLRYELIKQGRKFTHLELYFSKKESVQIEENKRDKDTIDMFFNMTDAQVNSFGNQLSDLPALSYLAREGESYKDLAERIKIMLRDPEKQQILRPHLKQLGFK